MLATSAAVFSVLLILTGVAKVVRPQEVERALSVLGFPTFAGLGSALGGAEVVVGGLSLFVPEMLWAQSILYAIFAAWVTWALLSGAPLASCGCLGRPDTPPSVAHIVLNSIAAALSAGAALGSPLAVGVDLQGLAQVVVISVGVFLTTVIIGDMAALSGARR